MVTAINIFTEVFSIVSDNILNATVTAAYIDKDIQMPQVVIFNPIIPRETYVYGGTKFKKDGYIEVEVLAYSSKLMKTILEDVQDCLFNNYKTSTSMKRLTVSVSDSARVDIGGKSAHTTTLTFEFILRD